MHEFYVLICEEGHRETEVFVIAPYEGGLIDKDVVSAKDCRTKRAVQFAVDMECGRACDDRGGVLAIMQDDENV